MVHIIALLSPKITVIILVMLLELLEIAPSHDTSHNMLHRYYSVLPDGNETDNYTSLKPPSLMNTTRKS